MNHYIEDEYSEFVAAAEGQLRRSPEVALDALGWLELLATAESDQDARNARLAFFQAQGAVNCTSGAFATLHGADLLRSVGVPFDSDYAGCVHLRSDSESHTVGVPTSDASHAVVDIPDLGVCTFSLHDSTDALIAPLDDAALQIRTIRRDQVEARKADPGHRHRAIARGREALSFEMLGAATSLLSLACEHLRMREQFGQPIGAFQSMGQLAGAAATDLEALSAVAVVARRSGAEVEAELVLSLKILAGNVGRSVAGQTLQMLGAIGFTWEHDHHRFHRRILVNDGLLGSARTLETELGRQTRERGTSTRSFDISSPVLAF